MALSTEMICQLLIIAASMLWGIWEGMQSRRNRRRAEDGATLVDNGSLKWIFVAMSIGLTIASFACLWGLGAMPVWWVWFLFGAPVMAVGAIIRLWAMQTLSSQFTHRVTILEGHRLVRSGLYKYIRHPSYLGLLLILVGVGLALANWISLVAATVPAACALWARVRLEEEALLAHFGREYRDYYKTTWSLVPFLW